MNITDEQFEKEIIQYADHIKNLLSAQLWQNVLLDCSKNELFILWLLFRQKEANMTQIADYINVPLNTATGIINRMEKKELIVRERDVQDKRVVIIRMGEKGSTQMQAVIGEFMYYAKKVVEAFTPQEMELLFRMFGKLSDIMGEEKRKETEKPKVVRITID
ncbi:MAG TPA: MarR family transcriptional regulator [Clostridiales bacterium]|nr:MarR family transcriptional regulator [Clostridiales bacterium]